MKNLFGNYVQLTYQLIKCQDRTILGESQEEISKILDFITQSMKMLMERQIQWDIDKRTQSFLVDIGPAIEDVDFVLKAIKVHLDLLENS